MLSSSCPLCGSGKARRACPALARTICAVCCGTKRLTEISCPATCPYLAAARTHPPAVVHRRQERDFRFFAPFLADLTELQAELLLFFQGVLLKHAGTAIPPLLDEDVSAGAAAVASTLETAGKGIIYQHQASSLPAQRLASSLEEALKELVSSAGSDAARLERDAARALRTIARAASEASRALPDEDAPVYLKLLGRLLRSAGPPGEVERPAADGRESGPRIIIPG